MLEKFIVLDSVTVAGPIKWPMNEIVTIAPASATQITSSNMTVVRFPLLCDIPSPFSLPPIKLYTLKSGLPAHKTPTEADEPLTSAVADISDAIFVMPPRIAHVMVPAFPFVQCVKYSG